MQDIILFLKNNLADHFVICFLPLYMLGGRTVAVLSAQFLGLDLFLVLPVVILLDTLQIPFFYHLYGTISDRLIMRRMQERTARKEKRLGHSRFFRWMQVMGMPGVVAITMIPMKGCGMWSGVLLAKLLSLPKQSSYPLLILGSILGSIFLVGIGEVILQLKDILVNH